MAYIYLNARFEPMCYWSNLLSTVLGPGVTCVVTFSEFVVGTCETVSTSVLPQPQKLLFKE